MERRLQGCFLAVCPESLKGAPRSLLGDASKGSRRKKPKRDNSRDAFRCRCPRSVSSTADLVEGSFRRLCTDSALGSLSPRSQPSPYTLHLAQLPEFLRDHLFCRPAQSRKARLASARLPRVTCPREVDDMCLAEGTVRGYGQRLPHLTRHPVSNALTLWFFQPQHLTIAP